MSDIREQIAMLRDSVGGGAVEDIDIGHNEGWNAALDAVLDSLGSLADDPQAVERAAIRMWASDLGGHGIDAGIAWDDATEGERQWYRNIFLVGLRAAEGEQTNV